jgi:phosphate-selective porin OprO/OprP
MTGRQIAISLFVGGILSASEGAVFANEPEGLEGGQNDSLEQRVSTMESEWSQFKEQMGSQWFRVYWKDSLRLELPDKSVKLRIGGRAHIDATFVSPNSDIEQKIGAELEDAVRMRRARIYLSGLIYECIEFKFQYDFAGSDADFKDVYVGMVNIPVIGGLRVGQMKEPHRLEVLTSSNEISFTERSLATAFSPVRNTGAMAHGAYADKRVSYGAGVFKDDTDNDGDAEGNDSLAYTARVGGLVHRNSDGSQFVHLGASGSLRYPRDSMYRARVRPEARSAGSPRWVDTGTIDNVDMVSLVGLEGAGVFGPFSVQGEYNISYVNVGRGSNVATPTGSDNLVFKAGYLQASYLLTGEHRGYKAFAGGAMTSPKPKNNFGCAGGHGWGAWELLARISRIDLDHRGVQGGREMNYTGGVNWYLNRNTRMMFNYVFGRLDQDMADDRTSFFITRVQFAF